MINRLRRMIEGDPPDPFFSVPGIDSVRLGELIAEYKRIASMFNLYDATYDQIEYVKSRLSGMGWLRFTSINPSTKQFDWRMITFSEYLDITVGPSYNIFKLKSTKIEFPGAISNLKVLGLHLPPEIFKDYMQLGKNNLQHPPPSYSPWEFNPLYANGYKVNSMITVYFEDGNTRTFNGSVRCAPEVSLPVGTYELGQQVKGSVGITIENVINPEEKITKPPFNPDAAFEQ